MNLKSGVLGINTIGDATRSFMYIQKAPDAVTSPMQVIQAHLTDENNMGSRKDNNPRLPQMHPCHSVDTMPLGLVREVGRGKSYMPLEHSCEALLLIVGGRPQVDCPRHISCPIPILRPTVYKVELISCDSPCSLFSWPVMDYCPVWSNRAGKEKNGF